jgi:hypothetical protein
VDAGQLAFGIHPEDIDRFQLLPAPQDHLFPQLLETIFAESRLEIAIQPLPSDFSFTPGHGLCSIAALGMISHCCSLPAVDAYPTLKLDDFNHRLFLRSIITTLQASLTKRPSEQGGELRHYLRNLTLAIPPLGPIRPIPAAQYLPSDLFILAAQKLSLPI